MFNFQSCQLIPIYLTFFLLLLREKDLTKNSHHAIQDLLWQQKNGDTLQYTHSAGLKDVANLNEEKLKVCLFYDDSLGGKNVCLHALLAISWWRCCTLSHPIARAEDSCWTPVRAGLRSMRSDGETSPLVSLIGRDVFQSAAVPLRHSRWLLIKPEWWCRIKAFIDPATHVQLQPAELSAPLP